MTIDKAPGPVGWRLVGIAGAIEDFVGDVLGRISRPPFGGVEGITRRALSYCPEMKFRTIVSRSASAASVSRKDRPSGPKSSSSRR
jgi:hypothetical protein